MKNNTETVKENPPIKRHLAEGGFQAGDLFRYRGRGAVYLMTDQGMAFSVARGCRLLEGPNTPGFFGNYELLPPGSSVTVDVVG